MSNLVGVVSYMTADKAYKGGLYPHYWCSLHLRSKRRGRYVNSVHLIKYIPRVGWGWGYNVHNHPMTYKDIVLPVWFHDRIIFIMGIPYMEGWPLYCDQLAFVWHTLSTKPCSFSPYWLRSAWYKPGRIDVPAWRLVHQSYKCGVLFINELLDGIFIYNPQMLNSGATHPPWVSCSLYHFTPTILQV